MATEINIEEIRKNKVKKRSKFLRRCSYFCFWLLLFLSRFNFINLSFELKRVIPPSFSNILFHFWFILLLTAVIILGFIISFRKLMFYFAGLLLYPLNLFLFVLFRIHKPLFFFINLASRSFTFTKTMRYKALFLLIFVVCCYWIYKTPNSYFTIISMVVLFLSLTAHFIRRFYTIFRPFNFFYKVQEVFFKWWEGNKSNICGKIKCWKEIDPSDKEYVKKRNEPLRDLWTANRIFKLASSFLGSPRGNLIIVVYFIISTFITLALTIFIFATEYYGLVKLNPSSFLGFTSPNFFTGLYLSFLTITTTNYGDIIPKSGIAQLFISFEILCGIIIGVLLFFIFYTITLEQYRNDLKKYSERVLSEKSEIIRIINNEYGKDITSVISPVMMELIKDINDQIPNENTRQFFINLFNIEEDETF